MVKHAAQEILGKGQVVPNELRPVKSETLYSDPKLHSPHARDLSYISADGKGGEDLCGPYEPVENWQKPVEEGWRMCGGAAVYPESPDRVFTVSHRGIERERTTPLVWGRGIFTIPDSPYSTSGKVEARPDHHVVVVNRDGEPTESWTWNDHLFGKLNRVFISKTDPDRHVWLTDSVNQKVYKFTNDGKELVMAVGEVEAGSTQDDPWKGQDIAWLANGDFYTAGLGRIDRFTAEGKHVFSYAKRGTGPGEFHDLHGLVLDEERHRIYVADRGNSRIQIFDEDWNFLDQWQKILGPCVLRLTTDGFIWVGDVFTQKFLKYDLDGRLITSWGQFGLAAGCTWGIHCMDRDDEGNIYIAENYGNRVQKYRPRADADPNDPRLIGELVKF